MKCEFSRKAVSDLEEIGDYIARDNPKKAIDFVDKIRKCCFSIAKSPNSSPLRENLGNGIRMLVFERYLIFYTTYNDSVKIERVIHSARNLIPSFFN
ncbi:MAG: type II toxin-antitoxin system RelE/ParE family toxin [Bdellovibrionales bacterium]